MTRFLIISNCQVQPLKHGLAQVCRDAKIESVGVHVVPYADRELTFGDLVARKNDFAFVLSIPLSEDFGVLCSGRIEDAFHPVPVFSISNLTYLGVHPDICIIHPDVTGIHEVSQLVPGPIGYYHSQIALLAFMMELSSDQAVKMYCDTVYRYMGHYEAFEAAALEMRRRDEHTTIPIGSDLETCVRQGLSFLSHNHPTSFILAPYVNKIGKWLADNGHVVPTGLQLQPCEMVNFLAYSTLFPIYPEIARHHGLAYEGSYVFRTPTVGDTPAQAVGLFDFVSGEYQAFEQAGRQSMLESAPGKSLMQKYGKDSDFQALVRSL